MSSHNRIRVYLDYYPVPGLWKTKQDIHNDLQELFRKVYQDYPYTPDILGDAYVDPVQFSVVWHSTGFIAREMLILTGIAKANGGESAPLKLAALVHEAAEAGKIKRGDADMLIVKLFLMEKHNRRQRNRERDRENRSRGRDGGLQ